METKHLSRRGRGFDRRQHNQTYFKERKDSKVSEVKSHTSVVLKSLEGWILFIKNLHEETTEDDIKQAFSEYGDVKNINLNLDRRTGFVKGYALVEYETYEQAVTARDYLNNSELLGVTIKVNWCFVTHPAICN